MKTILRCIALSIMIVNGNISFAQKTLSEGTIEYNISIKPLQSSSTPTICSSTVFLKGSLSRIDMISELGNETTIHDSKSGTGVILKEYSGQKLMTPLTKENWIAKNKKFEGLQFINTDETVTILGYACKKATAKMSGGSTIVVYYTSELSVINKDYSPTFANLAGVPLKYEFTKGGSEYSYVASAINFNPIPTSKFDYPKSGYRIMEYNEK